LTFDNVT